jgi:hypothetical protein
MLMRQEPQLVDALMVPVEPRAQFVQFCEDIAGRRLGDWLVGALELHAGQPDHQERHAPEADALQLPRHRFPFNAMTHAVNERPIHRPSMMNSIG